MVLVGPGCTEAKLILQLFAQPLPALLTFGGPGEPQLWVGVPRSQWSGSEFPVTGECKQAGRLQRPISRGARAEGGSFLPEDASKLELWRGAGPRGGVAASTGYGNQPAPSAP